MPAPARARAVLAAVALGAGPAAAQDSATAAPTAGEGASRSWLPPLAALVVPGSGQLLLGQDRGVVYLAVEAFAFAAYLHNAGIARGEGDRFRELAFAVARRGFAPQLRDTTFEYFETMTRFPESGAYDLDPGPALAPEIDAATHNGAVWLLARRTYWADPDVPPDPSSPEYIRAIQFYQDRAVGPNFQWSWRDAALEQRVFTLAIHRSDAAYRRAGNYLGLLLANHVVSVIDALVSSRLTRAIGRPATVNSRLAAGRAQIVVSIGR